MDKDAATEKNVRREISITRQWRLIRELIRKIENKTEQGEGGFLRQFSRLEPIHPYNRLRAAEELTRKLRPTLSLKILDLGMKEGESRPLYDYERVYALWVLGKAQLALNQGKKATRGQRGTLP
jgi:hypothetical protein